MYPNERVACFVVENFIPVRVHVRDQAQEFQRLGAKYAAQWTPTILVLDPDGTERHRVEGFLPVDDLIAQLTLGLGHSAFVRGKFEEAARHFREVADRHAGSEAGAETTYWAGVSRYKTTNDGSALADTARRFREQYQDTSWAKKASVWGG